MSSGLHHALQLPRKITLESMYKINDQSIWFLIWILKKENFWKDLTKEVLEEPFVMKREYFLSGQIKFIYIMKNDRQHGIERDWSESGQLWYEGHWKDGKRDGIHRGWYENGKLYWEEHWKDENGQLYWEHHWKDGKRDGKRDGIIFK